MFLTIISVIFAFFGAYFRLIDSSLSKDEKTKSKLWYQLFWEKLDKMELNMIPFTLMKFYTKNGKVLYDKVVNSLTKNKVHKYIVSSNLRYFLALVAIFIPYYAILFFKPNLFEPTRQYYMNLVFGGITGFLGSTLYLSNQGENDSLKFNRLITVLQKFCLVVIISYPITLIAIYLDKNFIYTNLVKGQAAIWINLLFDFLTIFLTYKILIIALKTDNHIYHILYILLDIIVSAILSFLVAFFINIVCGLGMDLNDIIYGLIGRSDNNQWELFPLFWTMHTTFIPTFIFLALILVSIISKLIIIPISKFSRKTIIVDEPHKLMSNLFLFLSVVLASINKLMETLVY